MFVFFISYWILLTFFTHSMNYCHACKFNAHYKLTAIICDKSTKIISGLVLRTALHICSHFFLVYSNLLHLSLGWVWCTPELEYALNQIWSVLGSCSQAGFGHKSNWAKDNVMVQNKVSDSLFDDIVLHEPLVLVWLCYCDAVSRHYLILWGATIFDICQH